MYALKEALDHSKKVGISECEIVSVRKKTTTVRITDSTIAEIKHNFEKSFGIRLVHVGKIVSIQTTDPLEINKKIDTALKSSSAIKSNQSWGGFPSKTRSKKLDKIFDKKLEEISGQTVTDIAETMINSVNNTNVNTITGSLNIVSEDFEIVNSSGLNLKDKATYIAGIINAESENSTVPVSGIGHNSRRTLDNFNPERIGEEAKAMCLESRNPKKIESGNFSIIFEPYSFGEILAFVAAANFNFKTVNERKSCFSDKLQEKISVDQLNLLDNPHLPEGLGTKSFDDEGVETRKRNLIENGIFKNTFSNIFDSNKENKETSGNAIRIGSPMGRSAEPIPVAAPHNLEIISGEYSQEDMIKETSNGLLVGRLWYTYAVNPIKGDFSCTARSGIRIIKNGKITSPGKSVRIIHNLLKLLQNISAIGNNQKNVMQWASLPSKTPSIKIENIPVITI